MQLFCPRRHSVMPECDKHCTEKQILVSWKHRCNISVQWPILFQLLVYSSSKIIKFASTGCAPKYNAHHNLKKFKLKGKKFFSHISCIKFIEYFLKTVSTYQCNKQVLEIFHPSFCYVPFYKMYQNVCMQ